MCGTKSLFQKAQVIKLCENPAPMTNESKAWSIKALALLLYPFVCGAVAINLFMLALMWQALGLPALTPMKALLYSIPLGVPASWLAGRWLRKLMDEAE